MVERKKWKPEPWWDISHGEYKLKASETIYFGNPVGYSGGYGVITQDSDDLNKIWVVPYETGNAQEACIGVAIETKVASGAYSDDPLAGLGGKRRDIGIMHEGFVQMMADNPGTEG